MVKAYAEGEDGKRSEVQARRLEVDDIVFAPHLPKDGTPYYTLSGREGYWKNGPDGLPVKAAYCKGSVKVTSLTVPGMTVMLNYVLARCDHCTHEIATDGIVIDS